MNVYHNNIFHCYEKDKFHVKVKQIIAFIVIYEYNEIVSSSKEVE